MGDANRLLVETHKLLWVAPPQNYTGAAMTARYVTMKHHDKLTIVIQTGAWAGGTAAVTVNEALTVAGGTPVALAFTRQWNDVAVQGTLVETAVVGNTFNLAVANRMYVIPISARSLTTASNYDCVSVMIASPGANNDFYSVCYIMGGTRYQQATPPTVIVD